MFVFCETKLKGVKLITPSVFEDHRGKYVEIYNEDEFKANNIDVHFMQDDISVSVNNVLRGIHGDSETWKLISCLYGEFYLVVVNCDKDSEEFGEWESFTLSDLNRYQVLVPPKYGNGHYVLSEKAIFHYKQNTNYNPDGQFTYKWNDTDLAIDWPTDKPILSKRDEIGEFVK